MVGRYEVSDNGWAQIEDIVSPPQLMGRPRRDDRQVLNGIFWVLCSGAKWRDLPERYGPWSTAYERFRKWRDDGTFEPALFMSVLIEHREAPGCWHRLPAAVFAV